MREPLKKRTTPEKFAAGKKLLASHGGSIVETNAHCGTITYKTVMGKIVADYEYRDGIATFHVVKLPFCLTEKQVWRFIESALE